MVLYLTYPVSVPKSIWNGYKNVRNLTWFLKRYRSDIKWKMKVRVVKGSCRERVGRLLRAPARVFAGVVGLRGWLQVPRVREKRSVDCVCMDKNTASCEDVQYFWLWDPGEFSLVVSVILKTHIIQSWEIFLNNFIKISCLEFSLVLSF